MAIKHIDFHVGRHLNGRCGVKLTRCVSRSCVKAILGVLFQDHPRDSRICSFDVADFAVVSIHNQEFRVSC